MKGAGKSYHEECKGRNPDEHKKGPPSLHVGSAMLSGLPADEAVTGHIKTDLKSAIEMLDGMTVEEATMHIKLCKVSKCWKEGSTKVQFHFSEKLEEIVGRALVMTGATLKYGKPSPGALEQRFFRAMGEE